MVKAQFLVFDKEFQAQMSEAADRVSDLTIPFGLITESWFKSNRAIFALSGPGKYVDLKNSYKKVKARRWGFVYPILKARGDLAASITQPGDKNSITQVINKRTLVLGTKDPKAEYHQFGTKVLPARPFILLGAEQVSPPGINNRRTAWMQIIQNYVLQVTGAKK